MKRLANRLMCFLLLAPIPVGISPVDSTGTKVTVTGGFGQFANVSRNCSGEVIYADKNPFDEINASITHKLNRNIELGIKTSNVFTESTVAYPKNYTGEYTRFEDEHTLIVNPTINFGNRHIVVGVGLGMTSGYIPGIKQKQFPSLYLGFGNMDRFYLDMSLFHKDPLISSGYFKIGVGARLGSRFHAWTGLGTRPYDAADFVIITETRVSNRFYINAMGRVGDSAGISENAFNLGLSYKLR